MSWWDIFVILIMGSSIFVFMEKNMQKFNVPARLYSTEEMYMTTRAMIIFLVTVFSTFCAWGIINVIIINKLDKKIAYFLIFILFIIVASLVKKLEKT